MHRPRRLGPLLGWTLGLVALLAGLHALGGGALAGPELAEPGSWSAWLASRGGAAAAVAVLRLVGLALGWYLLALTVLASALRLGGARRLVTAVDLLTLPWVRGLVQAGLGVGVAGASVAAVGAVGGAAAAGPAAAVLVVATAPADAPPVMQRLEEPPPSPAAASEPRTWTVAAGDHLWAIAERVLAEAWRRPAADGEVAPYWQQIVSHNRDRLADPGNPDLLFTGQVLVVPAPPAPP